MVLKLQNDKRHHLNVPSHQGAEEFSLAIHQVRALKKEGLLDSQTKLVIQKAPPFLPSVNQGKDGTEF